MSNTLVFGASGGIGAAICDRFAQENDHVIRSGRAGSELDVVIDDLSNLGDVPKLDAVVWAQGLAADDSIRSFTDDGLTETFDANCRFVAVTLRELLRQDRIARGARLCIVSSAWQEESSQHKFTYAISKAALGGLVRSAAVDLAEMGILINAVLPGAVDTPMANRPHSSAKSFAAWTPHGKLISAQAIAETVAHLCSPLNGAITGQSIVIDLGASIAKLKSTWVNET